MADNDVGRAALPADAIDGVLPGRVLEPSGPSDVAEMLARAATDGRSTVVRGGGTKLGWGRVAARVDQVLSMAKLQSPLVHRDGDLTATVGAGVRLADLNARLREKGQWLPVESAFAGTSIGGLIATNESGPLRHRYGTPRDLLIGVTVALADGRVVKAGGTVVKNVAGYDLGRFLSGSLGSLAVVLEATFKLAPTPKSTATVCWSFDSAGQLGAALASLTSSQLEPAAIDVRVEAGPSGPVRRTLMAGFGSSPAATNAQVQACCGLLPGARVASREEEAQMWHQQVEVPWRGGATVRFGWLPSAVADVVGLVEASAHADLSCAFVGRAGVGAGLLRIEGTAAAQARAVERLRQAAAVRHVVLLSGSPELKASVDVWGEPVGWHQPLAALKRSLDPTGILGAGRGPL
ncbi:MAG TPA: FAD-binding oxidoreductase [Vicinamibacterales bacterium]